MVVTPAKGDSGQTICLKCLYIKRGSFKGLKLAEWLRLRRRNPQLAAKLPDCDAMKGLCLRC